MGNCVPSDDSEPTGDLMKKQRKNHSPNVDEIYKNIIKIQSNIKGYLIRKKFRKILISQKEKRLLTNLNKYALELLKKKHFNLKLYDYSSEKSVNSSQIQIKRLQSLDTNIFYYGEWLILNKIMK